MLTIDAVLPRRRILKGNQEVFEECRLGSKPNMKTIGTKRKRTINSGADDVLDDCDGEEDDDDEDILTKDLVVPHMSAELNLFTRAHG